MANQSKIPPLDVAHELPDRSSESTPQPESKTPPEKEIKREADESGIVSPVKNEILAQHAKEFPEGDPAVRRIRPDRGSIPIEDVHGNTMDVHERKPEPKKKAG